MATGYTIYDGPSTLDGERIVVIALTGQSSNTKTGAMVQTYILRPDVDPISAVRQGKDASICGDCPHRGDGTGKGRTCYVTLMHGPSVVYRNFAAGKYPIISLDSPEYAAEVRELGRDRAVRLGTYGDPGAVPIGVWIALTSAAAKWTGYTHQWRIRDGLKGLVMASCDTTQDHADAQAQGWRTFRVRTATMPALQGEIACPASEEMGKRTQCADCGLCNGAREGDRRKSITIIAHGTSAKRFQSA